DPRREHDHPARVESSAHVHVCARPSEEPQVTTSTVSVVMTAWNAERFLEEAVRSVLAQTRLPAEIVLVDDGSTDGTAALAKSLDERVHVVRRTRGGSGAARATGIGLSSGA